MHQLQGLRLEQAGGHRITQPGTEWPNIDDVEGLRVWQCHGISVSNRRVRDRIALSAFVSWPMRRCRQLTRSDLPELAHTPRGSAAAGTTRTARACAGLCRGRCSANLEPPEVRARLQMRVPELAWPLGVPLSTQGRRVVIVDQQQRISRVERSESFEDRAVPLEWRNLTQVDGRWSMGWLRSWFGRSSRRCRLKFQNAVTSMIRVIHPCHRPASSAARA